MVLMSYVCILRLTSRLTTGARAFRIPVATANVIKRCRTTKSKMTTKTDATVPPDKIQATRFVSVDLNDENPLHTDASKSKDIDFENHLQAFSRKSTWEITRALCVLRMCAINYFVDNSFRIMSWTKRRLGSRGLRIFFKPLFFKQFVGGENQRELQDCLQKLNETGIRPMLAAAMEDIGEDEEKNETVFDSNCSRILECLELATVEETPSPMMQLKITSLLPEDILVILANVYSTSDDKLKLIKAIAGGFTEDLNINSLFSALDDKKISLLKNGILRLKKIGEEAQCRGVKILVDAEYTYLNPGLSLLTMAMAAQYNHKAPQIWNTYQCYLKDEYSKLCEELELANQLNTFFGAKLVRGAYMIQERERAQRLQIPDPVCCNYEATNDNYNVILKFMFEHQRKWPKCSFIVASHNEDSIRLAIQKMEELEIDSQNEGISFGQLYGMCDQITYPLALSGYAVYKSIPYGTIEEVLPYLARRATENKSVLEGTRKEQALLWKEMKHRLCLKPRYRTN